MKRRAHLDFVTNDIHIALELQLINAICFLLFFFLKKGKCDSRMHIWHLREMATIKKKPFH